VTVRMKPDDVRTLDRFIAAQPDPKPSRGAVIRRLLQEEIEEYRALDEIGLAKAVKLGR
jgi:metal-responsive CopG/Arc/MetJ family transcriptional regulator